MKKHDLTAQFLQMPIPSRQVSEREVGALAMLFIRLELGHSGCKLRVVKGRLHALVSTTVIRAYANDRHACTPCVADTAVRTILEAELGSAQAGTEIGRNALAQFDLLR